MTISGFLPQRWRASPEAARHAEAIAGVLHTAPLEQTQGPGIISLLGTAQVLPYLVAIKSLHRRLGRGSIAIVDDGTLTGEDRAILAHHCSDPQIVPHQAVRRGPFPAGAAWALLLTILDRRAGQFWMALDPHTVTRADVPEVAEAIASNRSFCLASGEGVRGPARRLERRLAVLCGTRGWRYRHGSGGLIGFAAGGNGRALAGAFHADAAVLGEEVSADLARNLIIANESGPVVLPRQRYGGHVSEAAVPGAAFAYFPDGPRHGADYSNMSRSVIAEMLV
ncbi:MAG: hypothetical protein ACXWJC_07710 [Croceibacterium sp.]